MSKILQNEKLTKEAFSFKSTKFYFSMKRIKLYHWNLDIISKFIDFLLRISKFKFQGIFHNLKREVFYLSKLNAWTSRPF